jgi:hypothetical protein
MLSSRSDSNIGTIYLPPGHQLSALSERLSAQNYLFAQHDSLDRLAGRDPLGLRADEREGIGFGEQS